MNFENLYEGVKELDIISIIFDYIVEKKNRNKECVSCQEKTSFPNICTMCDETICCDECITQCYICGQEIFYECCGQTCGLCDEVLCENCIINYYESSDNLCTNCLLEYENNNIECEKCDNIKKVESK